MPFCYAEAAANLLTNPALDPFGKIPEFKFCAVRAERIEMRTAASDLTSCLRACRLARRVSAYSASWPGLSRPSTSFLRRLI